MMRSNLCGYSDPYILSSGAITTDGSGDKDTAKQAVERNRGVIFKNWASFTDCIGNINNTQIDNAK